MRNTGLIALTLLLAATAPAFAVNSCNTDHYTCATTMPVGGFCECTSHGQTEGGSVSAAADRRGHQAATAGGCGAQPNAPGCR
jgi:hypothetical protein